MNTEVEILKMNVAALEQQVRDLSEKYLSLRHTNAVVTVEAGSATIKLSAVVEDGTYYVGLQRHDSRIKHYSEHRTSNRG